MLISSNISISNSTISQLEWTADITDLQDVAITPEIVGAFEVVKHYPLNQSLIDLNIFNDIFIYNNGKIKIEADYNDVGVNINNREICPKYEYVLNKNITLDEIENTIEDCADANTLEEYEEYEKYGKQYLTLKPIGSEKIINLGKPNSFCGTKYFELDEEYVELKDLYLNKQGTGQIGEVCDCLVINKDDKSNNNVEKFDNINVNVKDFNLRSGSSYNNKKTLTGYISDANGEIDLFAYSFKPHFNENIDSFYIYCDEISENCDKVSQLFDGILFKNWDVTNLPSDYHYDFNPSLNKSFFKFVPSGTHRVGLREYHVVSDTLLIAVTYETKFVNNTDFSLRGKNDHIYKNMIRPLLIKKQTIDTSGNINTSVTETILPQISQSYKFKRDYILKNIKPYFSTTNNSYTGTIAVYFGFLINGKLNENGIVHTEICTYDDLVNGFDLPLPIHIPANKDFFIGFSSLTTNDYESISIKYIENGKYDTVGNLVSFPVDVQTVLFEEDDDYESRMLKIDLSVNVYSKDSISQDYSDPNFYTAGDDSSLSYNPNVSITTKPISYQTNRILFLNNDIIPSKSNLDYYVGSSYNTRDSENNPLTSWTYQSIKTNDEIVFKNIEMNYKIKMDVQTFDKYQSPIIKPLEQNYILKKYDDFITNERVVINEPNNSISTNIIGYSTVQFTGSSAKIQLRNLEGIYKASSYDEFMKQAEFYNSEGNIGETGFVIRLNFDYFQQYYSVDTIISKIPIDIIATNKFTGKRYRVYTSSYSFKLGNNINNVLGITHKEYKKADGWMNKNIEIVPFLVNEINNTFIKIKNIEDWDFDIEIMMENENGNSTLIRNIKTSIDTIIVNYSNVPSSDIIKPITIPPVEPLGIVDTKIKYFGPATIIEIGEGG